MKEDSMRTPIVLTALAFSIALSARAGAEPERWEIEPYHSSVGFTVRHMMVSNVTGEFTKFKGAILVDPKDITKSKVEAEIEVASLNTRVAKRDEHLKSPDFFDVAKYPKMKFASTKIQRAGADKLKVTGKLTLHGVTKDVVLEVEGPSKPVKGMDGKPLSGASATTVIDRRDFGLKWNKVIEAGGLAVGEKVTITLNLELVKAK
jgi:polyisoprenoid-binding protein YceI